MIHWKTKPKVMIVIEKILKKKIILICDYCDYTQSKFRCAVLKIFQHKL